MESVWKLLKFGGRLFYLMCLMFFEENEEVVKWFFEWYFGVEFVFLNGLYDLGFFKGIMRVWFYRYRIIGFFYVLIEKRRFEFCIVWVC